MKKFLLLTFLGLVAVASAEARPLENIPLLWKPTTEINSIGSLPNTVSLQVKSFADRRANKTLIAENREDAPKIRPVTTQHDVPAWCTGHFKEVLQKNGYQVSDHGSVVLSAELLKFFVLETGNYAGEVVMRVTLKSKGGATLWNGVMTGTAGRFGRSYKAENYYETLSDSLIDVLKQMRDDKGFTRAILGGR